MFIRSENEIISLMPTARWSKPEQLLGYLEEEERVALEPLLGTALYEHLCEEYKRLTDTYVDITAVTIKPTRQAREHPSVPYADVTERMDRIQAGNLRPCGCAPKDDKYTEVSEKDMQTVRLIRICQQIEFYKMLSHKAGLLTVSFNEGGGMNVVTADGYDEADDKRMERVVKDAFMSAGRAVDSLLLFLEADAKGDQLFTKLWSEADAFFLHKDLLFQTARVLNEYLDIKGERLAYVQLVRDIRFCQNTYLKPRIGGKLLKAVVDYANLAPSRVQEHVEIADGECRIDADKGKVYRSNGQTREWTADDNGTMHVDIQKDERYSAKGRIKDCVVDGEEFSINVDDAPSVPADTDYEVYDELLSLLRTALAFYVEGRRTELGPKQERLARRDSMTDAQQAMAMACVFIEENLDALGRAAVGTPIYNAVRAREEQAAKYAANANAACRRMCQSRAEQSRRKLFTGFPATHRTPELK